jgi:nucleotide-binding universal stress UspA family protein
MLRAVFAEHCFPRATDLRVEIGDPADRLIALAEEEDAELIVVGCRGRGEIRAELLGRVSSALMNRAPCPVVVMPRPAVAPLDAVSIRSVVCGIAGEEGDASLLRLAEDLARRLGGDLHVVHAYDPWARHVAPAGGPAAPVDVDLRRSAELRLATALRNTEVEAHGVVLSLRAAEALDRVAEEKRAGFVVVGSQGRSKLGSVLHGSVPTRLAAEGSTAVVVLPPAARLEPGSGHYECAAQAV